MYLGKNILYLRKLHNMTQTDLANRFGYDNYTTVHKWENDKADPPVKVVKALADLFNVDIDDLVRVDLEMAAAGAASSSAPAAPLSAREEDLIRKFRRMDERGKHTVEMAAEAALWEVSEKGSVSTDEGSASAS